MRDLFFKACRFLKLLCRIGFAARLEVEEFVFFTTSLFWENAEKFGSKSHLSLPTNLPTSHPSHPTYLPNLPTSQPTYLLTSQPTNLPINQPTYLINQPTYCDGMENNLKVICELEDQNKGQIQVKIHSRRYYTLFVSQFCPCCALSMSCCLLIYLGNFSLPGDQSKALIRLLGGCYRIAVDCSAADKQNISYFCRNTLHQLIFAADLQLV